MEGLRVLRGRNVTWMARSGAAGMRAACWSSLGPEGGCC